MKRILRFLSASMVLGLAVTLVLPSTALGGLTFTGGPVIASASYTYTQPVIGGRTIVCVRENISTSERDIVAYNRLAGTQTLFGAGDGEDQDGAVVSGDTVAWIDHSGPTGEVWLGSASSAHIPLQITNDDNDDVGVAIDGQLIAWMDSIDPGRRIHWYDMEAEAAGIAPSDGVVPDTNLPNGVCVDKGRICWFDDGKTPGMQGIYVYEPLSDTTRTLTEVDPADYRIVPDSIDLHGDNVVWAQYPVISPDNRDVYLKNLRSKISGNVTAESSTQESPSVFGDVLAWQDDATANYGIQAWWMADMGFDEVVNTVAQDVHPGVFGHNVTYQIGDASGSDIGLASAQLSPLRLAGANRYETSALISKNRFPKSTAVVIATGENFPDALAASTLAGALQCPLLLTRKYSVPAEVMAELDRLDALTAYIIGSTASVAASVQTQLDANGIFSVRIGGANRYATAAALVGWIVDIRNNDNKPNRHQAFFVRGDNFADALAVSPIAYALGIPILLVRTDGVPAETRNTILNLDIRGGYVIGSTAAISASTKTALDALLPDDTVRWGGANRYETSVLCAKEAVQRGWLDLDTIGVATGLNFPDALGGGSACGYYGSPIVLTAPTYVPGAVDTFFTQRRLQFGGMEAWGGTNAVSAATFTKLKAYMN